MAGQERDSTRRAGGNGHPVADNPLRLLFTVQAAGCSIRDMERNAKALKLQARHAPISPVESLQALCPRQRSVEDYALAQKQITDPVQLAVGLFFWPSDFGGKNLMEKANTWLLEAEGLPQGDGRKAELIANAIREFDSPRAGEWLRDAVATAGAMLEATPDAEAVRVQVGEAVKRVAERAIADFGDTIEASEIDLLNAIDACSRLPEIHGAVRAGEEILAKQVREIQAYLAAAYGLLSTNKAEQFTNLSAQDVNDVVTKCQRARMALSLLKMRPALLRKMPANFPMQLDTLSAVLAVRMGFQGNKWREAATLIAEVDPSHIDPQINAADRELYMVACSAIAVVYRASQDQVFRASQVHEVRRDFLQLRLKFPHAGAVVDNFERIAGSLMPQPPKARMVQRSQPPELVLFDTQAAKSSNLPPLARPPIASPSNESANLPSQTHPPANSGGCGNWGCGAVIVFFLLVAAATECSNPSGKQPSSSPPASSSYRVPKSVAGSLSIEYNSIESQRRANDATVARVKQLQREIDIEQIGLDPSNSFAVDQFNRKVAEYNRLVEVARRDGSALDARIEAYNARVRQNGR